VLATRSVQMSQEWLALGVQRSTTGGALEENEP
jgi:hypothetical protein